MKPQNEMVERERMLQEALDPGFFSDLLDFLRSSGKWWMLPLLLSLLLLGAVLVLGKTAVAPFIYSLF